MANSWFQFKQFTVHHHLSAMKVGTDGVLLGAWADAATATRLLDVGTGSGLLALMMAQRFPHVAITAIDLVDSAVAQACENVLLSPWGERIDVIQVSLQAYAQEPAHRFETIVCNPPYFTNSLTAPDAHRTAARHNHTLPFHELAHGVERLLTSDGNFCVVLPADQYDIICTAMKEVGMIPHRLLRVYPLPHKPAKRVLIEFRRGASHCQEDALVIESGERHVYTDAYRALTCDFYLKF
ncbi:tRNA1Val (adenine37-N6)-methyltransferase [Breznakibacter xylanolyticus]|uniref:tRNA1(Val) (adenine(37)-N6)-methyltransferase n=1 Tax=Breznakibacter xylanolyticus TaxID=990 RepID=A0A2W7NRE3_9BACT|nr:methyltransferase [Breznakibacter xylanolyticus]PZX20667.1 tRNA1Val (adenine37-N6)-methyltransferase [Breznakibacter xylanolyticus]